MKLIDHYKDCYVYYCDGIDKFCVHCGCNCKRQRVISAINKAGILFCSSCAKKHISSYQQYLIIKRKERLRIINETT